MAGDRGEGAYVASDGSGRHGPFVKVTGWIIPLLIIGLSTPRFPWDSRREPATVRCPSGSSPRKGWTFEIVAFMVIPTNTLNLPG
jgi:hypothetical protein